LIALVERTGQGGRMDRDEDLLQLSSLATTDFTETIVATVRPTLSELWVENYLCTTVDADLVDVTQGGFDYLFDLKAERLVAACGFARGGIQEQRDASRMAGSPKPGPGLIKGHAIAHQLGGGLDINLVPQNRAINGGAFRILEREAALNPGCFYWVHWIYPSSTGQIPQAVVQGLVRLADVSGATSSILLVKVSRHLN
jgi:hypothetical protein